MSARPLADVLADVIATSADGTSVTAVLDRLGAAVQELLPGACASVLLDGAARPVGIARRPGRDPGPPVEVALAGGGQRVGVLRVYPGGGGGPDADSVGALRALATVAASCVRAARANEELRASLERTRLDALHDPLTGLPNRALLLDRIDQALVRSRRTDRLAAVLFVDLDHFKRVNDRYGHHVGDALLVAVAGRLRSLLRRGDTAARLSGDEFVVVCEDLASPAEAEVIGTRLQTALDEPFLLAVGTLQITASVGIVAVGHEHQTASAALEDADSAMYDAKRRGGHRCQMIDLGRDDGAAARRALARDLAGAIERREIRPDYQPIVQTVDGRVTAVEALAHWDHPVRGPLGPAQCAPLAGRFGLVAEYERAILEQACSDRSGWSRAGRSVGLAVDVATPHLLLPGFPAMVAEALDATGTEPATLMLEMDEDAAAEHGERVAPVLERLRALGVGLAIEGFGTARSSLASLRNLEVDEVKLDSRLVGELPRDPASHAMVFATTELAHLLGMVVVAEGVETEEQRHQVTLLGCDYSQGRYFFPPVRADELSPLLA